MRGELEEISLVDLIQVTGNDKTPARLTVRGEAGEASLFFDGGEIVHAELGSLQGKEALFETLRWQSGTFELRRDVPTPARTLSTGSMELLLAAMASIDSGERQADGGAAPKDAALENDLRQQLEASGVDVYGERADQNAARRLRRLPGVEGAVLVARDGTALADDVASDAGRDAAVTVLVGNAGTEIGAALALGALERGVVEIGGDRMLVIEQPKYFAGLLLGRRASPELAHAEAKKVLEDRSWKPS